MVDHRSFGLRTLSLFWRLAAVTMSLWGWFFIWEGVQTERTDLMHQCLLYNEFLLIGILLASGAKRRNASGHEFIEANRNSVRQMFFGLFSVLLVAFVLQDLVGTGSNFGELRLFFLSYVPWLYLTLLLSNYLLPRYLSKLAFSGDREERVALVGTVEQANRLKPWLQRKTAVGLRPVGLISPQTVPAGVNGFPILGTVKEIESVLKTHCITQVILLDLTMNERLVRDLTSFCEKAAVRLLGLYDLNEYFSHSTVTFEDDGVRFIGLREEPLESPLNRFMKRTLDLVMATPVVVFILPLTTVLVWVLQRWQSPGPIFFWQVRTGMMGRSFRMLKYRTMHRHNSDESRQATKDDPRVYPAGRWLRKLNIDELPQFLNVLYGNMSVVGPRPHLSSHDELWAQVEERYPVRKFIKPGITGWAQVSGFRGEVHSETDIRQRIEADITYLENWSLALDGLVIGRTMVQCVLPSRVAY